MIDITKSTTIFIGRRGEHHFRNITFDVSSLLTDGFPGAALSAVFKRPDGTAYPVVTNYADGVLTWSPNSTDTVDAGVGRLEIRVTYGAVIGKSARVLAIIEEALTDSGSLPPDPPAQEWLNQVLSALASLDLDETMSLLNSIYNLLNDNYNLNTETSDKLYNRTGIILHHLHPVETATAPDLISRRASISFTDITNGDNVVLGGVTYTFVSSHNNPAANTVQINLRGTLRENVQKLAEAIRGVDDEENIAYGADTGPNPTCTAYWTSKRFSIGDIIIPEGESLFILEKAEDATDAIPITTTAVGSNINPFTRMSYLRYILSGNSSGPKGSVRGPLHTVLPINSVAIGGQGGQLLPATYDCHLITLCRQSDTTEKELDFYISNDEENFTRIQRSTPIGASSISESLHIQNQMRQSRIPPGYGLYICMGSDGSSVNAFCDLKFTYHLYPADLTTIDCNGL